MLATWDCSFSFSGFEQLTCKGLLILSANYDVSSTLRQFGLCGYDGLMVAVVYDRRGL